MTEPVDTMVDVVEPVEVPATAGATPRSERSRSLIADAWDTMRARPMFWIAAVLIVLIALISAFPGLFGAKDPNLPNMCFLSRARQTPGGGLEGLFGFDSQGCSIYFRTVYGARASVLVGLGSAIVAAVIGALLGVIAGYLAGTRLGWVDAVLSRVADIFFAIPMLLGAIVIMYALPASNGLFGSVIKVVFALALLGWPNVFRLMRSSVLQVRPNEYVLAAQALGARAGRLVATHVLPNAMAPVIVLSTLDLGGYIATEATLSFLGVGLPASVVSWGRAISDASPLGLIRQAPFMLLFPAAFLCITILSFLMLGEIVRDALDPKLR